MIIYLSCGLIYNFQKKGRKKAIEIYKHALTLKKKKKDLNNFKFAHSHIHIYTRRFLY